jgi:hypothetical protein
MVLHSEIILKYLCNMFLIIPVAVLFNFKKAQHPLNKRGREYFSIMNPRGRKEASPRFFERPQTIKRNKTVATASGNFVIRLPVSEEILSKAKYRKGEEFTNPTYTAVVHDRDHKGRDEIET